MVHEPAAIRLFQALGFSDLGGLPNMLRVLDPRDVLTRLDLDAVALGGMARWIRASARIARASAPVLGPIIAAGMRAWAAVATGSLRGLSIEVASSADSGEIDALWRAARDEIETGPIRTGARFLERYEHGGAYVFVLARAAGRLVGVGVVKRPRADGDPRLRGVRIATLSDLLYRPSMPRAGLAVLRGAEQAARSFHAHAVLCSASAAAVAPLLRRRGYLRLPPNLHVLSRVTGARPEYAEHEDWWITRSDSEGDGAF
jgi:hypothetical protein